MKKTRLTYKKLTGAGRYATRAAVLLLALAGASISQAATTYSPVPITATSYNQDAIVESNATPRLDVVTTATVDQGTNNGANTWFEQGYDVNNPGNGLPPANTVFTAQDNANYSFRTPPTYAGPNGILIDTVVTSGTFTVTTPATYTLLSFLGSGGNGGDVIRVRVNHQDGSFEIGSFGCPDWFGGTGIAFTAGGRCQSPVTFTTETDGANPRIYFRDMTLTNTTSPVTSIVLSYQSGNANSHNDILGVSGATTPGGPVTPIIVTGYTYDFVVEASAAKRGRVVSQKIIDGTNAWATTITMDNEANTGFTFYEKGHDFNMINNGPVIYGDPVVNAIAQASGIPVHGTTFFNPAGDHSYTMAPDYTTNDVVWLSPVITNATITLVTPAAYTALSFLDAAGNGPVSPTVIVHHQNGNSETNVINIVDWFSSTPPTYIPNGRVQAESGQWSQQLVTTNGADRLFASDFILADTVSPVTSIDLVYTNTGGRAGIFAVAGATGPVTPIFTQQPTSTNSLAGNPISFTVQVTGTPPFTYQWQKGTNGVFVNLSNGGNVSGATTATLVINPANYFADAADYRVIVSNGGGSSTSGVATASLVSTLTDVTQPGDPITFFGGGLFGDGAVANAIDNGLAAKWGANVNLPANVGCVITPSVGATLVTGLRLYTANDAPERDPANYRLEGSINSGASYTLIASNLVTMPDGRNNAGGAPDPLASFVREVSFSNTNGYTSYRLSFTQLKGGAGQGSFQLGEVELLGVTTNLPLIVSVPSSAKAFNGGTVSIAANVSGTPAPTSRWQKQVGPNFVNLADGGAISGSQTTTLTINPAVFSDAGNYRIIATNTLAAATSAVVVVTIYDTNVDVTLPSDPITDFGNTTLTPATPSGAIDDNFSTFTSRGDGLNANAGFPPWGDPVGLVVTPQTGPTVVTALRIYTGGDGTASDPADVKLEGSNNGGTSYSTILPKTALSLPDDRNASLFGSIDPLTAAVQEIRFANSQAYSSYRLTFEHLKDDNNTFFVSIGEIELLGVAGAARPFISSTVRSGNNLLVSGSGGTPNGSLSVLTNANIAAPVASWGTNSTATFDGSGNFSLSLPINAVNPRLFYLIKTP
jgi:hypothetical protein